MDQNTDRKGDRLREWIRIQTERETEKGNGPEYRQKGRQKKGMDQNTDRKGDRQREWTRIQTERETEKGNGPEYRQKGRQKKGMDQNTDRKGDRQKKEEKRRQLTGILPPPSSWAGNFSPASCNTPPPFIDTTIH